MDLGWKVLIPAALAWLMVVSGFQIAPHWGVWALIAAFVLAILFWRSVVVGRDASQVEAARESRSAREVGT